VDPLSLEERPVRPTTDTVLDAAITTRGGKIMAWTHEAEEMFGWTTEEALGRTIPETILPPFRIGAYQALITDLKRQGPNAAGRHREGFGRHRNGRIFAIEVSSTLIEVGGDRLVSHRIRDISERKVTEEALHESNQLLQALLDSLSVPITVTDAEGRVTVWNRAAEDTFGWTVEEVCGGILPICPPEQLEDSLARTGRVFDGETITDFQAGALLRDGARIDVNATAVPVYGSDGKVSAAMWIISDITDQQRAAAALRERNQLLKALLNASPLPITATDLEGRTTLWNAAAEREFGWTVDEAVGHALPVVPPEDVEGSAARRERVHGGEIVTDAEVQAVRRDGSRIDISLSAAPIYGPDGRVNGSIGVMLDITERLHAFELLRKSDEERRRLLSKLVRAQEEERRRIAADIHDDSVQVLTALALRLELLRRKTDDPSVLEGLADAERTARLAITRLRHLMFELRPPVLDRDGLAAALRMQMEQVKHDYGIECVFEDELTGELEGETRVVAYRIAQEALVNVVKHANASTVRVRLRSRRGGVIARVTDNGRGFDPTAQTGAHFGLVAMRERAEMAGGWCRVRSFPGVGSVVEFFVPETIVAAERAA
jgi:PAS domain S-box-containing protein